MSAYYHRSTCRLCDSRELELVVPLTPTPPADDFIPAEKLHEPQECFPLDMYLCRGCGHVQLLDIVNPDILFRHYSYFSGRSPGLVKHFEEYAQQVLSRTSLPAGSLVVDIGSNDGCFLRMFSQQGMQVLGVDPAENIAAHANASGIETLPVYFDAGVAKDIRRKYGPAAVVSANNVFAHTDDMAGMTDAIRQLLADDGVFVFEVSYLLDVVDHLLVGSIFHEHVCYHSVKPLVAFLRKHGLELIHVERVSIQGGSIIGTAQRLGGPRAVDKSVTELLELEDQRRLDQPDTIRTLSVRLNQMAESTRGLLQSLHDQGKSMIGFGAARGGTLILHHFGLAKFLEYLVDDNPDKQGLYSPGHHLPVYSTQTLYDRMPDYAFILAWVHTKPIVKNHRKYLDAGGSFVSCFPQVEIFSKD